jgi:hypothetical protein
VPLQRDIGEKMRLDTAVNRSSQSDVRTSQDEKSQQGLMTPARRAALDALERELQQFLQARPLTAA